MRRFRARAVRAALTLALLGGSILLGGCSSIAYGLQAVGGHLALLSASRPVADWLADPSTPAALRERLALSQRIRDFAVTELKEPDNASYRRYADLKRSAVVWNVVAAPPLSLDLRTWCFPVVGCVGYRGYFDPAQAQSVAQELRGQGLEVSVYGVPAYSTLGRLPLDRFADPLLNTFIDLPEGELARLIFHELAHQVAFVPDDMVFNESFATAVERLGGARWMAAHASPSARQLDAQVIARRQDFRDLTERYRARLDALYRGTALDEPARLTAKAELMAQLRAEHRQLKQARWDGYGGYDAWFAGANNASLGVLAAYHARVPEFEALFERGGRDFDRFYAEVRRLARLPAGQRLAGLR